MNPDARTPGQVAYEEWMAATGRTDSRWSALGPVIREAWEAAARAVVAHYEAQFEEVAGT